LNAPERCKAAAANACIAVAALLAVGCSDRRPPAANTEQLVTSLAQIAGPWDIALFDGYEPTRLHEGLRRSQVHVDNDRLSYTIECNHSGNRASLDSSGTLHDLEGGRIQTLMGCPGAIGKGPSILRIFRIEAEGSLGGAEKAAPVERGDGACPRKAGASPPCASPPPG
jgi:hypothetical protein